MEVRTIEQASADPAFRRGQQAAAGIQFDHLPRQRPGDTVYQP